MQASIDNMGENAWLIRLGTDVDARISARVHVLASALRAASFDGIVEVVPAYASVLLRHGLHKPAMIDALRQRIEALLHTLADDAAPPIGTLHRIAVCYGGDHGADLAALARACGMTPDQVVRYHTAPVYEVAMTGFAPGFPYLLGMNPRLATPRRATPRTQVPTGSVGIAGAQTGMYPGALPGGWQLIGRTPMTLFDPGNAQHPCLLEPGDRVRFEAIDDKHFNAWPDPC